jgi:hypothetical protein
MSTPNDYAVGPKGIAKPKGTRKRKVKTAPIEPTPLVGVVPGPSMAAALPIRILPGPAPMPLARNSHSRAITESASNIITALPLTMFNAPVSALGFGPLIPGQLG